MAAVQQAQTIIIGGGAIGLSTAYHLASMGHTDIILLERHELSSGTSWHAAGIIGPLRASKAATTLASYAPAFFRQLEATTGFSTGYQQTGGWWLSQTAARDEELKRIAALGQSLGFSINLASANELAQQENWINSDGISLAMHVAEDGQANPVDICQALGKGASALGVSIQQDCLVKHIERLPCSPNSPSGYQLTVSNDAVYRCQNLVICGGMWSNQLLQQLGLRLPLMGVEHMYVVTDAITTIPNPLPITRDLDAGIYCKGDAGKIVLGGFERHAKTLSASSPALQQPYALFDEDWQQFEPFIQAGLDRFPELENTGIQTFINGPESFTHDTQPLIGPVPNQPGLYLACGMNSLGIVSAPGVGKSLAEWIIDGNPQWDLLGQDVSRAHPQQGDKIYMQARMQEAVANQFEMHWPYKQPVYGRDLKHTPVYRQMQQQNAVFGCVGGWERPLWFSNDRQDIDYSFNAQSWWPEVAREGKALQECCGLMDLSPFAKIQISGADALAFMQHVCSRDMDCANMMSQYCLVLNHQAGIIADVTVSRISTNHFLLIAAAACQYKLLDWCRQQAQTYADLSILDMSQEEAVLAIAGPKSLQLLEQLCPANKLHQLAFSHLAQVHIANIPVRIARLSFTGENGYELYCPTDQAAQLYELLVATGEPLGLTPIGLNTVDACRMEKGFVHWGHDIGPADNPLSANLMFAVAMNKSHPFIGLQALNELLVHGVEHQRVLLQLIDNPQPSPLLYHDEPIYQAGQLLGHTTSGALGARSRLPLCMAYLDQQFVAKAQADSQFNHCDINIAGNLYAAKVLFDCPYDPQHQRMRELPHV